ncbi:DUF763 domain-containing protein [Mucilaginibacter rubeus]|uniref:DUF763 domain-containing protein n=2 Tax=Mucilaginibacter TaxID=423349 RepID=A0AAE6JFI7_9SPHI|nr:MULTISPECIES: DUF763 domain-containing protein [Mucilaginibacter]QEM04418.1 DUF763 domain-containing protein [Mucilaginibacter rubeus]QEM17014.1 DUF763 domain-containing protein [Mucilaginibacter gossypii]QTE46490.1 DUF763 domain-containing protein [Mucilaginibacter rubeus]QTE53087.1 DUF763 domain-containing protein [Mucilaginibacter rubeus]QTE58174.1 DUF763 domain-containing protein [Mucilaginibacter rubeus]
MKRSGSADLPLHYGYVPQWLAERMAKLGLAVVETIVMDYGKDEVLRRLSDPFWFQSLGAVMGMDWHSSGITTSVMGALKKSINPHSRELGIYICGGKGKHSTQTPAELVKVSQTTGLDANYLVKCSKLSAKVDNTAMQDGFQLYTHNFILSDTGKWAVVQQGMSDVSRTARRYHWHSEQLSSFVNDPHTFIYGKNSGYILNMTDKEADGSRNGVMQIAAENPGIMINEISKLVMPSHHEVHAKDVDLKRLGAVLWLAHEKQPKDFEDLLLLQGLGPRTLQSLALVSEVIHGTPSRFKDPARFSFAHGGKDGAPFPVPTKVYDETLSTLQTAIQKAKMGNSDKNEAIKRLSQIAERAEKDFTPNANFDKVIEKERNDSWKYGGRTVFGKAKPPVEQQLKLF